MILFCTACAFSIAHMSEEMRIECKAFNVIKCICCNFSVNQYCMFTISFWVDVGTVLKVISVPKGSWSYTELLLEELQVYKVSVTSGWSSAFYHNAVVAAGFGFFKA